MTNIKKIGLTALAGSLAATSAFAGALDVTGTAKITYVSQDETEVTGNPYSMSQGIGFSGSGELDNGMTINYGYTMSDAAFSSSTLKLDMGDMPYDIEVLSFTAKDIAAASLSLSLPTAEASISVV